MPTIPRSPFRAALFLLRTQPGWWAVGWVLGLLVAFPPITASPLLAALPSYVVLIAYFGVWALTMIAGTLAAFGATAAPAWRLSTLTSDRRAFAPLQIRVQQLASIGLGPRLVLLVAMLLGGLAGLSFSHGPGSLALGDPALLSPAGLVGTLVGLGLITALVVGLRTLLVAALVAGAPSVRVAARQVGRLLRHPSRYLAGTFVVLALAAMAEQALHWAVDAGIGATDLAPRVLTAAGPGGWALLALAWAVHSLLAAPLAAFSLIVWTRVYIAAVPGATVPVSISAPLRRDRRFPALLPALLGLVGVVGGIVVLAAALPRLLALPSNLVGVQPGLIEGLAVSPDGTTLATSNTDSFFHLQKNLGVRLWPSAGSAIAPAITWPQSSDCRAVAFSPDGRWLAAALGDGRVLVWEWQHPAAPLEWHVDWYVQRLAWFPDSRTLAGAPLNGPVTLWDVTQPRAPARFLPGPRDSNTGDLAISADGRWLAAVSSDVAVWELGAGTPPQRSAPRELVHFVAIAPAGEQVATGGWSGDQVVLSDRATLAPVRTLSPHFSSGGGINQIAYSSDGRWLAVAGPDLLLWDRGHLDRDPFRLIGHAGATGAIAFSGDGHGLYSAGHDGTIRRWSLPAAATP